jgi:hypothetical protein
MEEGMMRNTVRLLMIAPVALALSACMDATAPRLPSGDEEGSDTTKTDRTGYLGQVQPPAMLA